MLQFVVLPNEFNIITIISLKFVNVYGQNVWLSFGVKCSVYVIRTCYSHSDSAETEMEHSWYCQTENQKCFVRRVFDYFAD